MDCAGGPTDRGAQARRRPRHLLGAIEIVVDWATCPVEPHRSCHSCQSGIRAGGEPRSPRVGWQRPRPAGRARGSGGWVSILGGPGPPTGVGERFRPFGPRRLTRHPNSTADCDNRPSFHGPWVRLAKIHSSQERRGGAAQARIGMRRHLAGGVPPFRAPSPTHLARHPSHDYPPTVGRARASGLGGGACRGGPAMDNEGRRTLGDGWARRVGCSPIPARSLSGVGGLLSFSAPHQLAVVLSSAPARQLSCSRRAMWTPTIGVQSGRALPYASICLDGRPRVAVATPNLRALTEIGGQDRGFVASPVSPAAFIWRSCEARGG